MLFHLVPEVTKQTSTSDDLYCPTLVKSTEASFDLPLLSFRLVSTLLFFPNTWSVFNLTAPPPPRVSDNSLPREMSKQKERRVYKKIVFRSSIVPRKSILLSFLTTLPPSILPFKSLQSALSPAPVVQLLLLQALAIPFSKSSFCSVSLAILPSGSARRESFTFIRRVLHHSS